MAKMPSIFMASHVDNVVKTHHRMEKRQTRGDAVAAGQADPAHARAREELRPEGGLPAVQLAVEIDKVMEVNVEEDRRHPLRLVSAGSTCSRVGVRQDEPAVDVVPNYYETHYPSTPSSGCTT